MREIDRPAGAGIDERVVAEIWERQAFDPAALAFIGFRIVFRGMPSDAGRPDYQDAILAREDGTLVTGDIEFHTKSSSWYAHGHHREPRYNGVILHVVWKADGPAAVRNDGLEVPTFILAESSSGSLVPVAAPGRLGLAVHPCVAVFSRFSTEDLAAGIEALGWMRFRSRSDLFAAELETDPPDQVAYRALLEGLGHASNRQAFRSLAETVPYGWLMSVPASERGQALLAGAGLVPPSGIMPPARLSPDVWRLSRLRPGNHPARRIVAVTGLLDRLRPSLSAGLAEAINACRRPSDVRRLLTTHGPDGAAIGSGRADELAASAVLPFVRALEPDLDAPTTLLEAYPSPPLTRWTRAMLKLLNQAGHDLPVKRALQHQGLHLLYTRYCRREGPGDCPICGRTGNEVAGSTRLETPPEAPRPVP